MNEDKKNTEMSQKEVAEAFGVTRNYIQQVEKRAMEKLRTELKKRGLKKEDYLGGD
jgi:DNA-directed RNA polymerase specialized sigma subunit